MDFTLNFATSESTAMLDEALSMAQGEIRGATKDAENNFFKSRYATLSSIWDAARGPLAKHFISVSQWPMLTHDGQIHIVTRLACGGEWLRATFSMPITKMDPQGVVSAVTYARRCALAAAVGISPEDDDGNEASTTGVYNPERNTDKNWLGAELKKREVPREHWKTISTRLQGKGQEALDGIIAEVKATTK